jgi:hypothetical protein
MTDLPPEPLDFTEDLKARLKEPGEVIDELDVTTMYYKDVVMITLEDEKTALGIRMLNPAVRPWPHMDLSWATFGAGIKAQAERLDIPLPDHGVHAEIIGDVDPEGNHRFNKITKGNKLILSFEVDGAQYVFTLDSPIFEIERS